MKQLVIFVLVLAGSSSFAGQGSCDTTQILSCNVGYSNETISYGTVKRTFVKDVQQDPDATSICVATLDFDTPLGQINLSYNDNTERLDGSIETANGRVSLYENVPIASATGSGYDTESEAVRVYCNPGAP